MTVHDDLATLDDALDTLSRIVHESRGPTKGGWYAIEQAREARGRVEAEVARLRVGLRRIENIPAGTDDDSIQTRAIARALLADQDGAARQVKADPAMFGESNRLLGDPEGGAA